ncbi:MAG: hypothetical protein HLUCCO16_01295 [Phormidium sp. OSCR]|nr:MAG: hypothetical protein HLUCCO16_01295 [Phormidium sp. OSCR]
MGTGLSIFMNPLLRGARDGLGVDYLFATENPGLLKIRGFGGMYNWHNSDDVCISASPQHAADLV